MRSQLKKSIPDWHLFITQMELRGTKLYAMRLHLIAYRSLELLLGMHTFNFNCFFDDFNCILTQICCLSRLLFFLTLFTHRKANIAARNDCFPHPKFSNN